MIFDKLSFRSLFSSSQNWYIQSLFGGGKSETGAIVTEKSAFETVPFFAIINKLALIIASLPFNVYKQNGDFKEKTRENAIYQIFHNEPNPEMDAFQFTQFMEISMNVYNNFYAQIIRDKSGRIKYLYPLPAHSTWPERNENKQIVYKTQIDGVTYQLSQNDVFHVVGFSKNGLVGMPIFEIMREAFGFDMALTSFGSRFFKQGIHPGSVVETPLGVDVNREKLEERLRASYAGYKNSWIPIYLDKGQTFKQLSPVSPADAQALESREFSANQLAAILGVPPHFVNYLKNATFSNVEQMGTELVQYTLSPKAIRYEKAIKRQLFTPAEKKTLYPKFELGGLLRGDAKTRNIVEHQSIIDGRMTINEARALNDRNPIDGGDVVLAQYNVAALNDVIKLGQTKNKDQQNAK